MRSIAVSAALAFTLGLGCEGDVTTTGAGGAGATGTGGSTNAGAGGGSASSSTGSGSVTSSTSTGQGGACANDCQGFDCCNGDCVNTQNDIHHCGANCGVDCGTGSNVYCDNGTCTTPPCDSGTACIGTTFCCGTVCCALDQICCNVPGPVVSMLGCFDPGDNGGTCPTGCILCACAAEGTMVATPDGERAIETLKPGDMIYAEVDGSITPTPLGFVSKKPVTTHEMVRVTLSSGAVLEMSAGHPLGDGRTLGDVRVGDTIDVAVAVGVETVPYDKEHTYDLLPIRGTGRYVASGVLVGTTLNLPR